MVAKIEIRRDSEKIKFTKSYKGQEIEESHDRPYPEETQHKEDVDVIK